MEPTPNASSPATPCARSDASAAPVSPSTRSSTSSRPSPARNAAGVSSATISPGVHDRDAVAEPLGLVEVVRREQDRHRAARPQAPDHLEQLVRGCAGRARRSARRGRAPAARRRAPGRSRAAAAGRRCRCATGRSSSSARPSVVGELRRAALLAAAGSTPHRRAWTSRLRRPVSGPVDDGVLEDDAACAARRERLGRDVEPGEPRAAAGRDDRGREHPDRRRLAGAVRADEAEHLAALDLEVDALHRLDPARVGLLEPAHLDRGAGWHQRSHLQPPLRPSHRPRLVRHRADGCEREDVTEMEMSCWQRSSSGTGRTCERSPIGCSAR